MPRERYLVGGFERMEDGTPYFRSMGQIAWREGDNYEWVEGIQESVSEGEDTDDDLPNGD